jgi:hypothetical protein
MSDSENTDGKEALDYFKNLTCGPADHIMSLQDMEKTIKFHEDELAAEDKRVEGTDEYPNYGDDFADMVYIARRLLDENTALAANQCHAGYAGEHGHHRCGEIDRLTKDRDEARLFIGRIFNEIDCRIEHGAESNGHLEAIRNLFKDKP